MSNATENSGVTMNKKKVMIIGGIIVVLLLNILWTTLHNKFSFRVDELKNVVAALEERVGSLENRELPDIGELKDQFQSIQGMSDKYEAQLALLVKAEEEQLAYLQSQAEAQRARVESLKSMFQ